MFAVAKLAKRICLSVATDLNDVKVIHGEDIIGNFPKGFRIKFSVAPTYLHKVATFVVRCLCSPPGVGGGATHVFVAEKLDGDHLFSMLSSRCNCRFISSHTEREELNDVALSWSKGELDVLISTSISLVGNENPFCRNVACAGYMFDSMQIVQAFGRLRKYMRSSTGQVLFAALYDYRIIDDQLRFKRLLNENFLSPNDFSLFKATMMSGGVHDWITNAFKGRSDCALKILSAPLESKERTVEPAPFVA
jgi:hypothetical protein